MSYTATKSLPDKYPRDLLRDGCTIEQDHNQHWPLHVWMDVIGVPPDPDCQITPKHSWCDLYSMQDSLEKAQKDCSQFLKHIRKELKKVGR